MMVDLQNYTDNEIVESLVDIHIQHTYPNDYKLTWGNLNKRGDCTNSILFVILYYSFENAVTRENWAVCIRGIFVLALTSSFESSIISAKTST